MNNLQSDGKDRSDGLMVARHGSVVALTSPRLGLSGPSLGLLLPTIGKFAKDNHPIGNPSPFNDPSRHILLIYSA